MRNPSFRLAKDSVRFCLVLGFVDAGNETKGRALSFERDL
jgi:hypothetical protein